MRSPFWIVAAVVIAGCDCGGGDAMPTSCGPEGSPCCETGSRCQAGLMCRAEGDTNVCRRPAGLDSGTLDAGRGDSGTSDSGASGDSGGVGDAGGALDAGGADAGPPVPENLYAIIGETLVTIDPATAAYTVVGATGGPVIAGTWDDVMGVAHVISIDSSFGTPTLATINLCTGAVTVGARLTLPTMPVTVAEGTVVDPTTGVLYVSVSADLAVDYSSESFGTADVATGAVAVRGTVTTLQNDIDAMTFTDRIVAIDTNSGAGMSGIYSVDPTTGATSLRATFAASLVSIAYSREHDQIFAYRLGTPNRDLVTVDLAGSTLTTVGTIHTDADFGGATLGGLFFAPRPTCP